jgi:hypothetical protein
VALLFWKKIVRKAWQMGLGKGREMIIRIRGSVRRESERESEREKKKRKEKGRAWHAHEGAF